MNKLKICVYAICKNESRFADAWMDSMGEADLVVVTDTGSEDDTAERLQRRGAVVYREKIEPWRFDRARNISLGHVPKDVDVCVCTDLDERFEPGWREHLETAWLCHKPVYSGSTAKTGRYIYNWSLKPDGTPNVQFYYFKVHSRHGFRWKCPVHEYVEYTGDCPLEVIYIPGMVLNHYPDKSKPRGCYLPLLETGVREAPEDCRMRYYLGREYMYTGQWQKSRDTLKQYLSMPGATWNEERCTAMRWLGECCRRLERVEEACAWYCRAVAEAPHMREPYVEFATMCYELGDWPMVLFLVEEALKITEKSKTYVNMGFAWDHTPHDLAAVAAFRMNMTEKALKHAEMALCHAPDNERLQKNLDIIRAQMS